MKYFENISELLSVLKSHLESPSIYDKDGHKLVVEIRDFNNITEISPLQVPVLFLGEMRFTNPILETDQSLLKIPNQVEVNILLVHFFQDEEYLRELTFDLADKIIERIDNFQDDKILDKELNFEVKYSKVKEGAFGSVLMSLKIQLNFVELYK